MCTSKSLADNSWAWWEERLFNFINQSMCMNIISTLVENVSFKIGGRKKYYLGDWNNIHAVGYMALQFSLGSTIREY
jgi:hypothetical protein